MKILERGDERVYKIECPFCLSKLEYEGKDISSEVKATPKLMCTERRIFCPVCHNKIVVL